MNYLAPQNWTWDQWKAFGRHVGTYLGGIITGLVTLHLITGADGATLLQAIRDITDGTSKIVAGVVAIIGVVGPLYTSLRSSRSAAPDSQVKSAAKVLEAGLPINGAKDKIINAVADQPEVKKVELVDKVQAAALPSDKVQ